MAEDSKAREQSSIQFPYVDLDEAMRLADVIRTRGGGLALDRDQLAVGVNMVPGSGAFGAKVGAARMFGLIESSAQGQYTLTELGFEILDASRERAAKARAFLNVPLYKTVFDAFKGKQLPPRPHGLENAFVQLGVSAKQKDKARQIFDRSARSAGYFATAAEDRLVAPIMGAAPTTPAEKQITATDNDELEISNTARHALASLGKAKRQYHPFIEGLLEELPEQGEAFQMEKRVKWLELAATAFDMMYGTTGKISIVSKANGEAN